MARQRPQELNPRSEKKGPRDQQERRRYFRGRRLEGQRLREQVKREQDN